MTDAVNEQLSACLDGELPRAELDLLLKRVERDPELRRALSRYALAREALRDEQPAAASDGFAARVMAAVGQEQPLQRSAGQLASGMARRLRPVAGVAVAAGVAALAVFSVQRAGMLTQTVAVNETAPLPVPVLQDDTRDSLSYVVPTTTSAAAFVPATRLTNYVVAHSEYSSPLGRRSVLTGVLAEDDADSGAPAQENPAARPQPQER